MENATVKAALGFAGAVGAARARGARCAARGRRSRLADDAARGRRAAVSSRRARDVGTSTLASLGRADVRSAFGDDVDARRGDRALPGSMKMPIRFDNGQQVALARGRAEQALAPSRATAATPAAVAGGDPARVLVFTDVGPNPDPFQESDRDGSRPGAGQPRRLRGRRAQGPGQRVREVRPRAGVCAPCSRKASASAPASRRARGRPAGAAPAAAFPGAATDATAALVFLTPLRARRLRRADSARGLRRRGTSPCDCTARYLTLQPPRRASTSLPRRLWPSPSFCCSPSQRPSRRCRIRAGAARAHGRRERFRSRHVPVDGGVLRPRRCSEARPSEPLMRQCAAQRRLPSVPAGVAHADRPRPAEPATRADAAPSTPRYGNAWR